MCWEFLVMPFLEESFLELSRVEKLRLSKEFVKFNERCLMRLLGDMRSYNYVIVPTYDFDQVQYRIRAMDFDQQSFEGNIKSLFTSIFQRKLSVCKNGGRMFTA